MKHTTRTVNFKNQNVYVGIDVHKKQYTYCIRTAGVESDMKPIEADPKLLIRILQQNYPGANIYSVYEAGFSGYGLHRVLVAAGINNIIVHPGDIPTSSKERSTKTDRVDARKLARELEKGSMKGIFIPGYEAEGFRALTRVRDKMAKAKSKLQVEIRSLLNYTRESTPPMIEKSHWSGHFIAYLQKLELKDEGLREALNEMLELLLFLRQRILSIHKKIKAYISHREKLMKTVLQLQGIPGIGFTTAVAFAGELMGMDRFPGFNQVASYVGLIPSVHASGDREHIMGMSHRHHPVLRNLLIESAWVAVKKDRALTAAYGRLVGRMKKQMAIIRIAKKLLSRIRFVLMTDKPYKYLLPEGESEELTMKKMKLRHHKNSALVLNL